MKIWKNKNPEVYDALLESVEDYVADYYALCSHSCAATFAWQTASDSISFYAWDIVNATRDCNLELFQIAVNEVESTIGYDDLDSQIEEVAKHIIRHLIKERIDAHASQ